MLTKLYKPREFDKERGFTLIELLVVIVIIGILAAIALPIFLNQQKAAIAASVKSDTHNTLIAVQTALVTNPTASGFILLRPSDNATYAFIPSIISNIDKVSDITVPAGEVAVRVTLSKHNWVAINGDAYGYIIHIQSEDSCFWTEYDSRTGRMTNSDTSGAVEALTSTSGAIDLNGAYTVTLGSCTGNGSGTSSSPSATPSVPAGVAPAFTNGSTIPAGVQGTSYTTTFTATGTPAPTYSATGLPSGLSIDPVTGVLSGTPTTTNSGAITVTATNSAGSISVTPTLNITFNAYTYTNYFNNGASDVAAFAPHQGGATTVPILYAGTGSNYCPMYVKGLGSNTDCMTVTIPGAVAGLSDAPGVQLTLPNIAAGTYKVSFSAQFDSGSGTWNYWTVRAGTNTGTTTTKVSSAMATLSTTVTVSASGSTTFIFSPKTWDTSRQIYNLDDFVITRTS